ncbi:hypothetical protein I3843_15G044800 [Carya illinoinensis]|uniref:Uncharacterized protein n=1 Tax=Carya illinoinensis TaxID=32201 RepID=A0A8T1N4E3_CARIL|nr:hypothetical protein CIPAW_15G050000 [Carya illinoinensis]KAG7943525.1 hypothetical protein I3843_15G044800 [Carya illinoinensis]
MAVIKKSSATSMKSRLFVLGITILVVSAQFRVGESRALRPTKGSTPMAACDQPADGAESVGMASFVVSANNSSSRTHSPRRSLAAKISSGPSDKGPGH